MLRLRLFGLLSAVRIRRHRLRIRLVLVLWLVLGGLAGAQVPCADFNDCLKGLKSKDISKKAGAVFMLGTLKDRRATPVLIDLVKSDRDPDVRRSALFAIGSLKDPASVPALAGFLSDKHLRGDAVKALVRIGDKSSVKVLIKGLKNKKLQLAASRGLGEIADPSAKPALMALFKRTRDARVRGVTAVAISRINSIWGPSAKEIGFPIYPGAKFIPNESSDLVYRSNDPVSKISDFYKMKLKKSPLTFRDFKKRYETRLGETQRGQPSDRPSLIFVTEEQSFQGRKYPAKMILLQKKRRSTEIKIYRTIGARD